MTQSISWLRYRARDGVAETHFYADGESSGYSRFVEKAIRVSDSDPSDYNSEYRLLDTFFSDSMSEELLQKIFERASDSAGVRILVVDPTCPFAEHRAASIKGRTAGERAHRGLKVIAAALKVDLSFEMNAMDPDDPTLLSLIHQAREKSHISLKFYDVTPSGPLYFFKNIVLCGRFCSGESAIRLPWSMIVNDPHRDDDLYDILAKEFEVVWSKSYEYPGTWLQKRKQVFLSYSEHDRVLAEEICQRFQDQQIDCFIGRKDLEPGDVWDEKLRKQICESREFVVLLTPASLASAWVQAELGAAWALGLNITPAVLETKLADVLHFVGSRQAIDISSTEGKERLVNTVAARLQKGFGHTGEQR